METLCLCERRASTSQHFWSQKCFESHFEKSCVCSWAIRQFTVNQSVEICHQLLMSKRKKSNCSCLPFFLMSSCSSLLMIASQQKFNWFCSHFLLPQMETLYLSERRTHQTSQHSQLQEHAQTMHAFSETETTWIHAWKWHQNCPQTSKPKWKPQFWCFTVWSMTTKCNQIDGEWFHSHLMSALHHSQCTVSKMWSKLTSKLSTNVKTGIKLCDIFDVKSKIHPLISHVVKLLCGSAPFPCKKCAFTTQITFDLSAQFSLCFLLITSAL